MSTSLSSTIQNNEISSTTSPYAYVTLLTSDFYLPGAIVLAKSLEESGSIYDKVILITPESIDSKTVSILQKHFTKVIPVNPILTKDIDNLSLLGRPELFATLTKLNVWDSDIIHYERVAFLDADTLVVQNIDGIFSYVDKESHVFAAAPDVGWPDCFNSGVFVTKPSKQLFSELITYGETYGSFDGADQGLLNGYFSKWAQEDVKQPKTSRLPFTFNVTPSAFYSYLPALKAFKADIRVVHFIGDSKPWHWSRFPDGSLIPRPGVSESTSELIARWWALFDKYEVHLEMKSYTNLGRNWSYYTPPQKETPFSQSQQQPPRTVLDFSGYKVNWNVHEVRKYSNSVPKNTFVIQSIRPKEKESKKKIPTLRKAINTKVKSQDHDQDLLVMDFATKDEALLTPSATDTLIRMHPSQVLGLVSTPRLPTTDFEEYRVSWNMEELLSLRVSSADEGDDEDDLDDHHDDEDELNESKLQSSSPSTPPRQTTTAASSSSSSSPSRGIQVGPTSTMTTISPLRHSIKTKEFTISKDGTIEYHFDQQ